MVGETGRAIKDCTTTQWSKQRSKCVQTWGDGSSEEMPCPADWHRAETPFSYYLEHLSPRDKDGVTHMTAIPGSLQMGATFQFPSAHISLHSWMLTPGEFTRKNFIPSVKNSRARIIIWPQNCSNVHSKRWDSLKYLCKSCSLYFMFSQFSPQKIKR